MYVNIHDRYNGICVYVDTTIYFTYVYACIDGIFSRTEAEPSVALWLYSPSRIFPSITPRKYIP